MKNNRIVSVLGCGWLGFPLAKKLTEEGFKVKGSTTDFGKLSTMQDAGIDSYLVHLNPNLVDEKAENFFECDILFINIPPKGKGDHFYEQVEEIKRLAEKRAVKKIIFISSTSVYRDENKTFTEDDIPNPETESGKAMHKAENLLSGPNTAVIRFAGLVGPNRHPGRFFAGKTNIPNGNAPVNLIHLDDCTGIIWEIITKEKFGYTFNACTPHHPSKREFYTLAAEKGGFEKPGFLEGKATWKIIESKNLGMLNYEFKIKNWSHLFSGL